MKAMDPLIQTPVLAIEEIKKQGSEGKSFTGIERATPTASTSYLRC